MTPQEVHGCCWCLTCPTADAQLPKHWNHQPRATEGACEGSTLTSALHLSIRGGAVQCDVVGGGQRFAVHEYSSPCSPAASPSPLLLGGTVGKPIYGYFSPNQSKNQHSKAEQMKRNPMDWVCKAQQLLEIRNLFLS